MVDEYGCSQCGEAMQAATTPLTGLDPELSECDVCGIQYRLLLRIEEPLRLVLFGTWSGNAKDIRAHPVRFITQVVNPAFAKEGKGRVGVTAEGDVKVLRWIRPLTLQGT